MKEPTLRFAIALHSFSFYFLSPSLTCFSYCHPPLRSLFLHLFLLLQVHPTMTSKAVFRCVVCDAAFFNCASLASHSRTHITYACDLCDKVFAQQCRLKQHMRSHNGERPYACNACPKSFSNSSLLRFVDDIKRDKNSSIKDDHCASTRPLQS